MILTPEEMSHRDRYQFLIGTVLPRPIAWVSTISPDGIHNLAPFSYFTAVCSNPMTLLFCPGVFPGRDDLKKDTLRNVEATGEFVVNLTDEATAEAMNRSATELPPEQSEFEWAGVTPVQSETVKAPRVAEAPVSFECVLDQIVTVGTEPGGGHAVFGKVQKLHIRDGLYADGRVDVRALHPIGRLGGDAYTKLGEVFVMARLPRPE